MWPNAVVTHADGMLVTADAPGKSGELVVIYVFGLGQTTPSRQLIPEKQEARLFDGPFLNARTELLFVLGAFCVGVCRCFVSLYGVIESDLAVFHSLGMVAFTVVLGSGAMCLGRIVMMLGGFKVCVFCHIHSPCPEFPFLET